MIRILRRNFSHAQTALKPQTSPICIQDPQIALRRKHLSVFDMFSIGIGPSSSHTVGPMRAANAFIQSSLPDLPSIHTIKVDLYGSLALTGDGHGTPHAVILGLEGFTADTIDPSIVPHRIKEIHNDRRIFLGGHHVINFNHQVDLKMHPQKTLPGHPNGMRFSSFNFNGDLIHAREYYSTGGGFIRTDSDDGVKEELRMTFRNAEDLLTICKEQGISISDIIWRQEQTFLNDEQISNKTMKLWQVMETCIDAGINADDSVLLPGGLKVRRRAPSLHRRLSTNNQNSQLEYLSCYAMAVNEQNAAGGRIVTAPTNGAAGVIPALLKYHLQFTNTTNATSDIVKYLHTAAAIGMLFKQNASLSAAEVGCQGEIGVASSMAAAGLTAIRGGTPEQVENAAEIAMEHSLGLTCDPPAGLVQIPCIERNAVGAVKALTASQLALHGDGVHRVSLDQVIETMRQTGLDMSHKYKETSLGGLALNVPFC